MALSFQITIISKYLANTYNLTLHHCCGCSPEEEVFPVATKMCSDGKYNEWCVSV